MARVSAPEIYEGEVQEDIYGSWEDCSPGLYLDSDMVDTLFQPYKGKKVRVTIEVVTE
jgi:hypothetical protein